MAWNFFFAVVTGSIGALAGAGPLLKKIYFPAFAPVIGGAGATLFQTGIEVGLLLAVMVVLQNVSLDVPAAALPAAAARALFAIGIGLLLAMLNVRYRDVAYLVTIVLNLLFYADADHLPDHAGARDRAAPRSARSRCATLYELSPLTQFVEAFRDVVYLLQPPSLGRLLALTVVSVVVFLLGFAYFQRGSRDVAELL